jgi:AcrR family transcriptional regulator
MTNGFTRRKEQSKQEIRQAAWGLFSQFGVERVSIADIAHKAGVSQATIYNNFNSKDALAREFVVSVVDELVNRVQRVLTEEQPFWAKLSAVIQFISEMLASVRPAEVDLTVITNRFNLQDDPEIHKIRESARERMAGLLLGLIREGKQQGKIQADFSENAFKIYFKAFMDIFIDPQFQLGYYQDPKLVQELGMLMIYGLSGPKE